MIKWRILLIVLMLGSCFIFSAKSQNIGTAEQREALFDTLIDRTLRWEAWSPFKKRKNSIDYAIDAEMLRDDFVNASSEFDIVIALQRLSNLRQDRHLFVDEDFPRVVTSTIKAPILFWPDFSDDEVRVFALDTARNFSMYSDTQVHLGDQVIKINGIETKEYYELLAPFLRFSTSNGSWWAFAETISTKSSIFDPELYPFGNTAKYTLQRSNGTNYLVSVPYSNDQHQFTGKGRRSLAGYELLTQTIDADMYVKYFEDNIIVLLLWKDFENVANTVLNIIRTARENNLLNANVIFDISESSGGSGAPDLIRILAQKPFQTTWGNVRIGDYLDDFKQDFSGSVREWLDNDVEKARTAGQEYSPNVPFKLQYFSKNSDGIMDPALERFTGKVVMISGSNTGSQVDQCVAMMIDNGIPVISLGMPCGGYSNTWEYEPYYNFPEGSDNWFEYHWNIGHTIRPNGEVLEGNPALPEYPYLLSSENFETYYDDMIQAAEDTLLNYPVEITCTLETPEIRVEEGRLVTDFDTKLDYQWYQDNEPLEGETGRILLQSPKAGAFYQVEISDRFCSVFSPTFEWMVITGLDDILQFKIYPNPLINRELILELSKKFYSQISLKIVDFLGKPVAFYTTGKPQDNQIRIRMDDHLSGIYLMKLYHQDQEIYSTKLIVK
ncbi:T9SS type A sorting domain-containing protein [Fulvivirgaceae bacterium BMA10]|uniref:T9SS type A sorting domain-containing protein n=1 Tax=Splendidivirga corallicola TaxID=3051826 RepID=A0ABT8KWG2_9BACT|nr:T9SS type A sorting domain-containing protein [Fulvivirgaceae bacterium BMA10]